MAKKLVLCRKKRGCCPAIYPKDKDGNIKIGGKEEGFTTFTSDQFLLLLEQAKAGSLDKYVE